MRVLIIGGNRFFGRHAAEALADAGHTVTLLNRGKTDDQLGSKVKRIVGDRKASAEELNRLLGDETYDCVLDQVCYEAQEARTAIEVFSKRTKHYVVTSTISVYDKNTHDGLKEEEVRPYSGPFKDVTLQENYGEGKRQVETVFFKDSYFKVVAVRFPIVNGLDDYTGRLRFHIERVRDGRPIRVKNMNSKMTYISSKDAGLILKFLVEGIVRDPKIQGPVNVGSVDSISFGGLLGWIEEACGKKAKIVGADGEGDDSPYAPEKDWVPSVERLQSWGYKLPTLESWMKPLIFEEANR